MSFEQNDLEHEIEIEDVLFQILRELKLIKVILSESMDIEIDKGDLDE